MKSLWHREPVALLAMVEAAVALVVAFGLDLSGEQVGAISAFAAVLLGVTARSQVSPARYNHKFLPPEKLLFESEDLDLIEE